MGVNARVNAVVEQFSRL